NRAAVRQPDLFEGAVVLVPEQQAGTRVAGDVDVGPTVVIEIGGDDSHAVAGRNPRYSCFFTDVGEYAMPVISIKRMVGVRQTARAAVHWDTCPRTVQARTGPWRVSKIEIEVVGNEQVQMPVEVVIEKAAT